MRHPQYEYASACRKIATAAVKELNKTFLVLFQVLFVCLFGCFVYSSSEVENYIRWESIGGVSQRHLDTFSNLFVLLLFLTGPMFTMLSTTK